MKITKNEINILIDNLNKKTYKPKFFDKKEDAISYIKDLVKKGSIGVGGSETIQELSLLEFFNLNKNIIYSKAYQKDLTSDEIYQKAAQADWYFTSTNAITLDGELVNTDARGNRVSSMIYGPKNVLVVLGVNKIVKDIHQAINRIKTIAAVKNLKRLNQKAGKEMFKDIESISKVTSITHAPAWDVNMYVIIINEELGY